MTSEVNDELIFELGMDTLEELNKRLELFGNAIVFSSFDRGALGPFDNCLHVVALLSQSRASMKMGITVEQVREEISQFERQFRKLVSASSEIFVKNEFPFIILQLRFHTRNADWEKPISTGQMMFTLNLMQVVGSAMPIPSEITRWMSSRLSRF